MFDCIFKEEVGFNYVCYVILVMLVGWGDGVVMMMEFVRIVGLSWLWLSYVLDLLEECGWVECIFCSIDKCILFVVFILEGCEMLCIVVFVYVE